MVTQAVAQALVACGAPKGSIVTVGSIVGKVSCEAGIVALIHTVLHKFTKKIVLGHAY